jgi:C-terminal processing protease CtpA/Prc
MNLLANTHALIIDLRQNHGGDPEMIALLSSYLFDQKPVHLNSLYWRDNDSSQQFWTLPYVPGKRFGKEKPVYVLTSGETFSGAEEFTYNLKNLKRATIIGESTGGGAHPGGVYRLGTHFEVFIPNGRAINPISGTNWEGTGVQPDITMPREEAFKAAYNMALKQVLESIGEPSSYAQGLLVKEIQKALAEQETASVSV